jgi:hypothetical protein
MASLPSLVNLKPTVGRTPPSPYVVGPETKIIKVKQPWAHALVAGEKDVENRKWPLTPGCGPGTPAWFLVCSSKSHPTRALMKDYYGRIILQNHGGVPTFIDAHSDFIYGKIIGLVKLRGCYSSWDSVWYNHPDTAWVVEEAWEFKNAVDMNAEDGMQTQGTLGKGNRARFGYLDKVRAEISRLDPFPN